MSGEENQINSDSNQLVKVNPQTFAAKYKSKIEIFRFLATDCGVYLPEYNEVSIFHLKDIAANKRTAILNEQMKNIKVPYFKGLSIECMLEFAKGYPEALRALPMVQREIDRMPREYIANVIFIIVGKPFQDWMNQKINERHEKVAEEKDTILMDPAIYKIF